MLFADAAEVSLLPTITRCWSQIGHQRVIHTPGIHAPKQWDWGAVDPLSGHTLHLVHPRRNNVGFRRLLAAISRAYDLPNQPDRQVVLFVDNDKAHQAKVVHRLLEKHHDQIRIEWLPPCSPELNPKKISGSICGDVSPTTTISSTWMSFLLLLTSSICACRLVQSKYSNFSENG